MWRLPPRYTLKLASGETVGLPVLGDWRDRDGDRIFLSTVTASAGSAQVSRSNLTYTAPERSGTVKVTYSVSDGQLDTPHTISITVLGKNDNPVATIPDSDVISAVAGTPVTFNPLANDFPGADPSDPNAELMLTPQIATLPRDRELQRHERKPHADGESPPERPS